MTTPSVEQVFVSNQTNLVNKLLELDDELIHNVYNHREYYTWKNGYCEIIEEEYDEEIHGECDFNYIEIYQWLLVSPYYKDKVKEMGCPYLEYKGQMWAGQTFGGLSWENSGYWKIFE